MFDDCKGEKLQELLVSFSTAVLRKVLASGQAGKASIAGRLAVAKRVTSKEHESLLPLAIAHRASLSALLRSKRELKEDYNGFGQMLKSKEQELNRRFEAVISTQNLLDQHVIPDHTVSRISALFEKNWKGDDRMVKVIAQGEGQGLDDDLLDKPFEEAWSKVSSGKHSGEKGKSRHGLLEDLERRVAEQQARLSQWKGFREAMKRDSKPRIAPNKQDVGLTRTASNDQDLQRRKERDFVFSPRKSPRKSGWESDQGALEMSPTPSKPAAAKERNHDLLPQPDPVSDGSPTGKAHKSQLRCPMDPTTIYDAGLDSSDNSAFSEISGGNLHCTDEPDQALSESSPYSSSPSIRPKQPSALDRDDHVLDHLRGDFHGPSLPFSKPRSTSTDPHISSSNENEVLPPILPNLGDSNVKPGSKPRDEDDILAEQIISMAIDAAPTPAKPKLSLAERTRQSMAFVPPNGFQGLTAREASPLSSPSVAVKNVTIHASNGAADTLLERTRQSISMLPPKPRASRKSTHNRRESKIYPTNQFETPKKQLAIVEEATPPEVLFSPGAGYDSVFKSRPKIALSPTPSPMPCDGSHVYDGENGGVQDTHSQIQWDESPLARVRAKV